MTPVQISKQIPHCAGVDEAGRGPLAGPVFAAAVVLDPARPIAGLADSKILSAERREALDVEIRASACCFAIAWADAAEIDQTNILRATMLAMRRALMGLPLRPGKVLIDGNRCPDLSATGIECCTEAIVRGDQTVASISAASILAKVARDGFMDRQDRLYPHYLFAKHKGYPTAEHRRALETHGSCVQHRMTFGPLRDSSRNATTHGSALS